MDLRRFLGLIVLALMIGLCSVVPIATGATCDKDCRHANVFRSYTNGMAQGCWEYQNEDCEYCVGGECDTSRGAIAGDCKDFLDSNNQPQINAERVLSCDELCPLNNRQNITQEAAAVIPLGGYMFKTKVWKKCQPALPGGKK